MNFVQEQLVNVLREVAHPDIGVIEKVRSANDSLLRSMTTRAQQMDISLLGLKTGLAIWLPVVATAALALGSRWVRGLPTCDKKRRKRPVRSVTTDANAGSSCAASRSAAERKASLRPG